MRNIKFFYVNTERQIIVDEKDIELIIALAELGNVTHAAEKLFLTQPAVTRRIQNIESSLGGQILIRSKKGVALTPLGETLARYAEETKNHFRQMRDAAAAVSKTVSGTLRLAVSTAWAHYKLASTLKKYLSAFPDVHINLVTDKSTKVYSRLCAGEASVAILRGEFSWNEVAERISTENYYISYYKKISFGDLANTPYIHYRSEVFEQNDFKNWLADKVCTSRNGYIFSDSIDSTKQLVQEGLGWALLPGICLDDFTGCAMPISFDGKPFERNTYLLAHKSHLELPQVREFVTLLKDS